MCGHAKRRCGFKRVQYGRIGKVKFTNDPEFASKVGAFWFERPTNSHVVSDSNEKVAKYSKKNTRMQYERQLQKENVDSLVLTIEKLEFSMEKNSYNEMIEKNYSKRYGMGKNHKKWERNHRDCYSNREIVFE